MKHKVISIRQRFIVVLAVIIFLLLGFTLYVNETAREAIAKHHIISTQQDQIGTKLGELSDILHQLGINIYQASFFNEASSQSDIRKLMAKIDDTIYLLQKNPANKQVEQIDELAITFDVLFGQINTLFEVQHSVETRYPAMPIMLNVLQPTNAEFMSAVIEAMAEAKQEPQSLEQARVYDILRDLRYAWAQLISSVRVFVANRLGAFGPPESSMEVTDTNRKVYSDSVTSYLAALDEINKRNKLGLAQESSLAKMKVLHKRYDKYFSQVAEIYYSETWRADLSLMRDGIDPLLRAAFDQVAAIHDTLEQQSKKGLSEYETVTNTLSETLWMIFILISCLLVGSYFTFEYVIRRPLLQITRALVAEGEGKTYNPDFTYHVLETQTLLEAFANMRSQVHSRQLRLQTILDNAGEGILTIDKFGNVETFNNSAEILFDFKEEEIVQRDVSIIIPCFSTMNYQKSIVRNSPLKRNELIYGEQDVVGRRKDGTSFPLSIRLGRVILEGKILYIALVSDISERKAMVDRLTHLAERDSLTGLYNRHFFMDELERNLERVNRKEMLRVVLLYVDLDNFKYVNDTMGHIAGDKVLNEVAKVLMKRARGTDLLARLGGDEFAILLYEADIEQAKAAAEDYRKQLADYIFHHNGNSVDIGCSIGIAALDNSIVNKEELLSRADLACHIAKRHGKNRIHFYKTKDRANAEEMSADMGWARRIKNSIENNEFITKCQPILNVKTGKVSSYEILLRMKDGADGLIMPSGFLPSAERFGLSQDIDRWVIRHSMRRLMDTGNEENNRFSINLSAKSIGDQSILNLIRNELDFTALNPNNIVFEVTETSAISDINAAVDFLGSLHDLGFETALDDFGVGYSSFSYLKDLPVNYVKIDRSFVQNVANDRVKKAIVSSMNDVAHALGKLTVAEYVEDKTTLDFLESIGIDYCQGYYIGEPGQVRKNTADNIVYLN